MSYVHCLACSTFAVDEICALVFNIPPLMLRFYPQHLKTVLAVFSLLSQTFVTFEKHVHVGILQMQRVEGKFLLTVVIQSNVPTLYSNMFTFSAIVQSHPGTLLVLYQTHPQYTVSLH